MGEPSRRRFAPGGVHAERTAGGDEHRESGDGLGPRDGEAHPIPADVRIIATTDANPEEFLADGPLSEALYDVLSVDAIHVAPLRDRVDDIPLLARYFLDRMARDYRKEITGFVPEALTILTRHRWPGNVRELMNVVERAVLFSTNKRIVPDDVAGLLQGR